MKSVLLFSVSVLTGHAVLAKNLSENENRSYAVDQNGKVVRSFQSGECVNTTEWDAAKQLPSCNGKVKVSVRASEVIDSFVAESFFEFGKASLRETGKKNLRGVAQKSKSLKSNQKIAVVGYADPLGPNSLNQKLSRARAESVKSELVALGVPSEKVLTEGRGPSSSVVGNRCKGLDKEEQISCFQPERRIEVQLR